MRRFYIEPPLPDIGFCTLTGGPAHRIGRVLRMSPGDGVRLFDGGGDEVEGLLTRISATSVTIDITRRLAPELVAPPIRLYQALIRPARYEWLLEKATELGASAIQPVVTERSRPRPEEFGRARLERWQRIVIEAAEQCGRRRLPELPPPLGFADALRGAAGTLMLPWEEARRGGIPPVGEALRGALSRAGWSALCEGMSVFIGPEGGFAPGEVDIARDCGALFVSLGPRILRAETAALAALAIAADVLADVSHTRSRVLNPPL